MQAIDWSKFGSAFIMKLPYYGSEFLGYIRSAFGVLLIFEFLDFDLRDLLSEGDFILNY